jgi:hypothetical protein
MAAAEGEGGGRGKGRTWIIYKKNIDERSFSRANLAAESLRLGAVTSKVKSMVCMRLSLGCAYQKRVILDPVSGTRYEERLDENDVRGGFHSNHPHEVESGTRTKTSAQQKDLKGSVTVPKLGEVMVTQHSNRTKNK